MGSIKKNYFYNTLLSVSNILLPLITYPYVLRVLGPAGIGKVNFALSVMGYFLMFAQIGIPLYGIKEIAKVRDDRVKLGKTFSELFFLNMITSFFSFIMFVGAVFMVEKFRADSTLFFIVGITIAVNLFSIDWFYSGIEEYKYITLRSLGVRLVYIVMIFIVIKTEGDYIGYAALGIATIVIGNILNMTFLLKRIKLNFKDMNIRKYIKPVGLIFLTGVVGSIYNKMDVVLLGFMTDEKYVGFYTTNRRITSLIIAFVTSLATVLIPRLSYYINNNMKKEYNKMAERSINFIYFMSAPAIALILVLSDEIMMLFGGEKFLPASLSLKLVSFQVLMTGLAVFFGTQVILAHNDEKSLVMANVSGAVVNITINLFLIRVFLHNAPSAAIVASEAAVVATQMFLARKYISFRLFSVKSFHYFAGSAVILCVSAAIKYFLHVHYLIVLLSCFAAAFIIYAGYLAAVRDENVMMLYDYIRKRLALKNG